MGKLLREEPEVLALCVIVLLFVFGRVAHAPLVEHARPAIQLIRL
jgi:hypothetical protein